MTSKPANSLSRVLTGEGRDEGDLGAAKAATPTLMPFVTLVIWCTCIVVGVVGWAVPHHGFREPTKPQEPVQAQLMHVELTKDFASAPEQAAVSPPEPAEAQPPPPPEGLVPPQAPAIAVVAPSPTIAFPKPVDAAPQPIAAKPAAPSSSTIHRLTYGRGEGQQPAPEYPREAALAHQQGSVVVRFNVDADGHVTSAQAAVPCPWPLLNQSALRAIRETWRFSRGSPRAYEVTIEFELKQR